MALVGKLIGALITFCAGIIAGGFVVPIMWIIIRLVGLIPVLTALLGSLRLVMYLGGVVFGVVGAGLTVRWVVATMGEENRTAIIIAALGGAVGGLGSSVMFFPIVGLL